MDLYNEDLKTIKNTLFGVVEKEMYATPKIIKYLGGGSFGKVFKVETADGKEMCLKVYRDKGMSTSEAAQLKLLSSHMDVKMPEVLYVSDETLNILAMSYIDGKNVLNPSFLFKSKNQKAAFAEAVINEMLQWHEVSSPKFGDFDNPQIDNWHEYYRTEKAQKLLSFLSDKVKENKFSRKKFELLSKGLEIYDKIGDEPTAGVLIHGDLNIMNIMADPKTLKLTGFIDPCGTMFASREYDLFQLRNMWGDKFGLYEAYKRKYPLTKESEFRVAFFGAINEVMCYMNTGSDFKLWQGVCNRHLETAIKELGF